MCARYIDPYVVVRRSSEDMTKESRVTTVSHEIGERFGGVGRLTKSNDRVRLQVKNGDVRFRVARFDFVVVDRLTHLLGVGRAGLHFGDDPRDD